MEFIPCPKHNTSKICLIYFGDEKVKLICEQCLDGDFKDKGFQLNQILSIKKILMQPIYILTKLDWNNDLIQVSQNLASENKEQIFQLINQLELQIKQFQEQIANMLNNFKAYADKLQELKQQLISDMPKILDYDQLKKILLGLQESKEIINPDAIEQIQQQLNLYFQNIKNDNSQKIQTCFIKKMEEVQLKMQQENKLLGKYEGVKKQLDQLFDDQQKIASLILPNLQIEGILSGSKITGQQYFCKLQTLIKEKMKQQKVENKLIYFGSRDGLNAQSFWSKVNGQKNLLMIFKSQSNYIFGAYSPCQLQLNLGWVQDKTNSSFLFSQTHDEIYPIIDNRYAFYSVSSYGPTFGGGHDIYIATDFQDGYSKLGHSYQQGSKYQGQYATQLFGQPTPNIIECEIFEIFF